MNSRRRDFSFSAHFEAFHLFGSTGSRACLSSGVDLELRRRFSRGSPLIYN